MAQVVDTILEDVCRKGPNRRHVDWAPHLHKFANKKNQVPNFRRGNGISPNEGSAVSASYSTICALIIWLGSHGRTLPAQQFADLWAPGQDLTSPES